MSSLAEVYFTAAYDFSPMTRFIRFRPHRSNTLKQSNAWHHTLCEVNAKICHVIGFTLLVLVLSSCIDPVVPEFRFRDGFLLVDGEVTNEPDRSYVTISLTELIANRYELNPFAVQSVEVIADNGEVTIFTQVEDSKFYQPPPGFAGTPGRTYFIRIMTAEGQIIESSPETMVEAVPIDNLQMVFDQEAYFSNDRRRFIPSFRFLVDFQDPAGETNYYRYRYRTWEQEEVCLSCSFGQANAVTMSCVPTEASQSVRRYDYLCAEPCWERTISERVNVFSDEFINGNRVSGYEAARIDWDWQGFLLVIIEQQSITRENYQYNRVVSELSDGSGGLNSTLPAALDGNIDSETEGGFPVLGYFGVAATTTDRVFFDRDTVNGEPLPFDAAFNLDVPPPPGVAYLHPCEGVNRSNVRPEGWED